MAIHIYKDSELTEQISEGDMTNPDTDSFNGSTGETKDRQLFVANEQATLAAPVDSILSQITLAAPKFKDGDVIIIDSEQMRIISGGGTTTPSVQRAVYGTLPAAHAAGAKAYTAYGYTGLAVEPVDISGSDESSWCRLALTQNGLDAAVPGQSLSLGNMSFSGTISFWRRLTIPAGTDADKKTDLKLRITGTQGSI